MGGIDDNWRGTCTHAAVASTTPQHGQKQNNPDYLGQRLRNADARSIPPGSIPNSPVAKLCGIEPGGNPDRAGGPVSIYILRTVAGERGMGELKGEAE